MKRKMWKGNWQTHTFYAGPLTVAIARELAVSLFLALERGGQWRFRLEHPQQRGKGRQRAK